jgi:hypothetical protein
VALDTSDPVAGPQLIINEPLSRRICSLNVRSQTVTTLIEHDSGFVDGPVSAARFSHPCALAVAPNGVCFVTDQRNNSVRRIRCAAAGTGVERTRTVTTIAGAADKWTVGPVRVQYAASAAPSFRASLDTV